MCDLHPLLRGPALAFGLEAIFEAGVESLGYPGTLATHAGEVRAILDVLYRDFDSLSAKARE